MSEGDTPDLQRTQHLHQWMWLATSICLIIVSLLSFSQYRASKVLAGDRKVLKLELDTERERQLGLSKDLAAYEDQVQEATDKRQQLIINIADYAKQIELLKAKTERLERVHSELEDLDAALAKFRDAQERFEGKCRTLNQTLKTVANPQ